MTTKTRPSFRAYVMAVNRVERLLKKVTRALDDAGVDYAVIGGNAVAAWVATVDRDAARATKDVDLLVRRDDLARMEGALAPIGLKRIEVWGVCMFVLRRDPNPRRGVHLVFANERTRPHDAYATPDVGEVSRDVAEHGVIGLPDLVRMKLQAFRRIDQVHLEDMFRVGLIDAELVRQMPEDLRDRLREVHDTMDWSGQAPAF